MKAIGQHIPYDSMVVIFGCAADKDIDGMLDQIAIGADKVIFTKNGTLRSADPRNWPSASRSAPAAWPSGPTPSPTPSASPRSVATRGDIICVTGSFYLVGEAKRLFMPDASKN